MSFDTEAREAAAKLAEMLTGQWSMMRAVGSRYITGGIGEDLDILVLLKPGVGLGDVDLSQFDTKRDDEHYTGLPASDGWVSLRVGDINALLISNEESGYYYAWIKAAEVCRALHLSGVLLDKAQRIAVHQVIMDGYTPEEAAGCL